MANFGTAINCMDGRTQLPVIHYLQQTYGITFVDMITEPGPIRIVASGEPDAQVQSIQQRVAISMERHGSQIIAIVGHHDCAGNPVSDEEQWQQLARATTILQQWYPEATIVPLWVNERWEVQPLEAVWPEGSSAK